MEENDSDATLPSDTYTESQLPSQRSVRQKYDAAWAYVTQTVDSLGKNDGQVSHQGSVPLSRKRNGSTDINSYFKRGLEDQVQPTIKSLNSRFYQPMISKIASMGHGYIGPSYHDLRVRLLRDAKLQVSLIIDSVRSTWADTGCTLMADGWKDTRQRPLINCLVYCPKGITFIKSVDASGIYTNAENLCNLFADVVEIIGPQNVVHMVTDSAPNYKAAGANLVERYPAIYWSPCAAHCINSIFQDMGELPQVEKLTSSASKITVFAYNHKHILNWLRNRPGWREIIRPADTRFATNFIALQSLYAHKDDLQSMVVDEEFRKISRSEKAKRIMSPLIRLLRICDSDEKPSLPYVYEGMYRARWDKMLRRDIYAAAYFLNPAFLYDTKKFSDKPEITSGMLNLNGGLSETKLVATIGRYRDREGSFLGRWHLLVAKLLDQMNGGNYLVVIFLICKSSQSEFLVKQLLHLDVRGTGVCLNAFTPKREIDWSIKGSMILSISKRSRSYDPVDYESIDKTEFWIVEEEEEGELDYSELEDKLLEEYPKDGDEDLDKED
ncbi:uncharacterized protein LOC112085357 [Eutrema salsugineum]|uniref:uncharacterized protein LOC112085357 n=1 Tax=Eutrema salsugineum TaxID=72664 RepID=UPI000CECF4B1|nr:uncharacterized protein LOC112085357 [Eutrema salsugineum]